MASERYKNKNVKRIEFWEFSVSRKKKQLKTEERRQGEKREKKNRVWFEINDSLDCWECIVAIS